jgi:hypothetical protein
MGRDIQDTSASVFSAEILIPLKKEFWCLSVELQGVLILMAPKIQIYYYQFLC